MSGTHHGGDTSVGDLSEAILWHGGESEDPHERFRNMTLSERSALPSFRTSL
ncbi:MAG: hypothetical protein IT229_13115 [Flavobacteriales bacterium]|nr:hypothetical protein [Flavobacteriales bacterium]